MIRLIHLADLHLGAASSYLGAKAAERSQDFQAAFARAVDFAVSPRNGIDLILIAGDFFDRHDPDPDSLRFAIAELGKLKSAGIPVVLAPGNHDALGYPNCVYNHSIKLRELVHLIESPDVQHSLELNIKNTPIHVYGMAWNILLSRPPFDKFTKEALPGLHIAILHGTLDGASYFELHSRDVPLSLVNLAGSGMDYIALGHIHTHQVHKAGQTFVLYPGTLEGRHFSAGELGDKHLVVVELEEGKAPKIATHKWNRRRLQHSVLNLDREMLADEGELIAHIREQFADPNLILQLEISGTFPEVLDTNRLKKVLADDFFWLKIEDQTDVFNSNVIKDWGDEKTIRGLFVKRLQSRLESTEDNDEREILALALKLTAIAFQAPSKSRS